MNNYSPCEISINDKIIVLEEKKSKMIFINSKKSFIKKVTVDGCLITNGIRCDFLIIDSKGIEYFIELKGQDIEYAAKQLCASILKLSDKVKLKHSFIISSRCPLIDNQIMKIKKAFKQQFNSTLTIKNIHCEYQLS